MSKIISLIFIELTVSFILIAGCFDICEMSENKNISASIEGISRNPYYISNVVPMVHYNISVNITNNGKDVAKSLTIETYYCNQQNSFGHCENRTFNIGDLNPKKTVQRYFEYDIAVIHDSNYGGHKMQYKAMSCYPPNITIISSSSI
jgi:hypothetical protein